jgi:hypothetical protein
MLRIHIERADRHHHAGLSEYCSTSGSATATPRNNIPSEVAPSLDTTRVSIYSDLVMSRSPQDKPQRWTRWVAYTTLFGLILAFAPLPLEPGLSAGSSAVVILQKDFRFQHVIKSGLPLNFLPEGWVADWGSSLFTVDRKQNLRLWPVIASGTTRSPPRA